MWDSLQNLLPKVAGKYHFKKTLDAIEICREYRRIAPRIIPGESLLNTVAHSYKDNTLIITVANSAWAQQVHMYKHLILEEINKKYGQKTIKDIKVQLVEKLTNETYS